MPTPPCRWRARAGVGDVVAAACRRGGRRVAGSSCTPLGELGGVLGFDEVQVVDPGRLAAGGVVVVRAGFGVHVPADPVRDRLTHGPAVPAHLDAG